MTIENRHREAFGRALLLSTLLILTLGLATLLPKSDQNMIWLIVINVIGVLGFYLYNGLTGRFSIGQVAFMAMGGYISGILTIDPTIKKIALKSLPDWLMATQLDPYSSLIVAIVLTMLVAGLVGLIVVRLNDMGVIIATFAILIAVQMILMGARGWTGGLVMYGIPRSATTGLVAVIGVAVIFLAVMFKESRWGLMVRAAHDDSLAASSMGVNERLVNWVVFVLSAGVMAAGGALLGQILGSVAPRNFYLGYTIELIAMLIFGGQGSVTGAILGAVSISVVLDLVRKIESGIDLGFMQLPELFGATQFVMTGLILFAMYRRPQGVAGQWEAKLPFAPFVRKPVKDVALAHYPISADDKLAVTDLSKSFGGLKALKQSSFEVAPGEILGLIGPNGAGKSTLINTIMGGYFATTGTIVVAGQDATKWPAYQIARTGFGRTFQNIRLFPRMTVLENILLPLAVRTQPGKNMEEEALAWLKKFDLAGVAQSGASDLSYGQQRRLEIARALALRPSVLLLDEPAAGMNHTETSELQALLMQIRDEFGVGILIVEHDLPLIMSMCDRLIVLNQGDLIARGTPDEIRNNDDVITAYIGTHASTSDTKGTVQ